MAQVKKLMIYSGQPVKKEHGVTSLFGKGHVNQDKLVRMLVESNITPEVLASGESVPTQIFMSKSESRYWLFKRIVYEVVGSYTKDEMQLLVLDEFDKERRLFERLKNRYEDGGEKGTHERPRIPENVRIEVWRRDGGKCARCGSRERLEYDHIVPISRGGSNTARNIELLCESCNRAKSNNIV
jgi:hypothetical protein